MNAKSYQTKAIAEKATASELFKMEVIIALGRFYRQDWGDIANEDVEVNNTAVKYRDFILAAYETSEGKIWITADGTQEKEYKIVTVLFPSDY